MAIIKPSTRYTTHKIGSSSDPTKPINGDDYVIVESADAVKYPDGWIILITEIDADIYGREAVIRGVGGDAA